MKVTIPTFIGLGILLTTACAEQGVRHHHNPTRGNESFRNQLLLGAGSSRPAPLQVNRSFNLSGENPDGIAQLKLDPASNTWGWVTFDTNKQDLIAPSVSLEEWTRAYIERKRSELGIQPNELVVFDKTVFQPVAGTTLVTFTRSFQDRVVKGAFTQFIFNSMPDGGFKLREIMNNSYGLIQFGTADATAPSLQQAIDAIGIADLQLETSQPVIHPQLARDGRYEFRLATEYTLKDPGEGEKFWVTLDNGSLDILEASSNHIYAKHELLLNTYSRSYVFNDQKPRPFSFVGVTVNGVTQEADIKGVIDTDATQVTINLTSTQSHTGVVNLLTSPNQFYSFPATLMPGGKTTVALSNADPASLNTFLAVHEVVEYAKQFVPNAAQVPLIANGIQANVNMADQQGTFCNAFYNGTSINFFRQGNGCANTALINDVVYHEWGHALDDDLGVVTTPNGITDGAFSEGIGDIIGGYMIKADAIGAGFNLNMADPPIRRLQNNRTHPPANQQEAAVHSAGQIIGGSFWDLRNNLIAVYGPNEGQRMASSLFFRHLTMTDRYVDSYQSVLRLDDNDNNPATRSPSYCAINKAFARHALTGGVTEGDSCVDTDLGLRVRVDVDHGGGSLTLIASSFGADSIVACPGKVATCTDATPGFIEFTKSATNPLTLTGGTKQFYEAKGTVTVKDGITLFSRDATKKIVGFRSLGFKARDTSADLSRTLK